MVQILRVLAALALLGASLGAQNIHWAQILAGDRQGSGAKGLSNALTSAHFFVGDGSNVATDVAISGDASVTNAGVWTNVQLNGVSFAASPSTNTVPIVTASNTATYTSVPDCQDSSGNHLNYNNTTHALSCGTTGSASALSLPLSVANGGTGLGTLTAHGVLVGEATSNVAPTAAGSAHQYLGSGGASADPTYQDHPEVHIVPFANCVAGTAGGGANTASSNFTAACRAGTNNLGGTDQAIPSSGASLQFMIELPQDWNTGSQPYINVYYASGANTSGTVIWTASSACIDVSTPGGASDDPAFNAESAFSTQTMAVANRTWYNGGQFTAITSGNGCKALSPVIIKLAVSGTASSNINAYQAVITIPRRPVVQAN